MIEDNLNRLLNYISGKIIKMVMRNDLELGGGQSEESAQFIRDNGITLNAADLIELTTGELNQICEALRIKLMVLARGTKYSFAQGELDYLMEGPQNDILHQVEILRVINEIKPEVAAKGTINILVALDFDNTLKVVTNVMTPAPEVPFTASEKAKYLLAPAEPSQIDYVSLIRYIAQVGLQQGEKGAIIQIAETKPITRENAMLITWLGMISDES